MLIVVYGLIFVGTLLAVDALLRAVSRGRRSRTDINSRLRLLTASGDQIATFEKLAADRGLDSQGNIGLTWLARLYNQSGIEMTVPRRIGYLILTFLVLWIVAILILPGTVIAQLFFAIVATLGVAFAFVMFKRRRRLNRFITQLPEAIDVVVRSLQAGHPLNAAIALVAREMPDPVGSEFGMLHDQIAFGSELEDGLINLHNRVGADELKLLTVTLTVQRGTGGNLAEILENLSQMIRDRAMLRAKIRAISAEGRMTAVIMSLFPFGLFLMIRTLKPDYFQPLIETGYAGTITVVCLVLMAIGVVVLNRMVNFDF